MRPLRVLPLMTALVGASIIGCGENKPNPNPKPTQIIGNTELLTIERETIAFDDNNDKILSEVEIRKLCKELLGIKEEQVSQEDVNKLIVVKNLIITGHNHTTVDHTVTKRSTSVTDELKQTLQNFQNIIGKYQERVNLLQELESKK